MDDFPEVGEWWSWDPDFFALSTRLPITPSRLWLLET